LILFSKIVEDLIGKRIFDDSKINPIIQSSIIKAYDDACYALYMQPAQNYSWVREKFKSTIKKIIPCLYEKADSLRFERSIYQESTCLNKSLYPIFDQNKYLKQIDDLFSYNPFIYISNQKPTNNNIFLEISDIYSIMEQIEADTLKMPLVRADLLFDDNISEDFIFRNILPTYMIGMLINDISQSLSSDDANTIIKEYSSILSPMMYGEEIYYSDIHKNKLQESIYTSALKSMDLEDGFPAKIIHEQMYNDDHSFSSFIEDNKLATGVKLTLVQGSLFNDFGLFNNQDFLSKRLPFIENTLIPMFRGKYLKQMIMPEMEQSNYTLYSECVSNAREILKDINNFELIFKVIEQIQLIVITNTLKALNQISIQNMIEISNLTFNTYSDFENLSIFNGLENKIRISLRGDIDE
jgi:hypothetical protein